MLHGVRRKRYPWMQRYRAFGDVQIDSAPSAPSAPSALLGCVGGVAYSLHVGLRIRVLRCDFVGLNSLLKCDRRHQTRIPGPWK